MPPHSIALVVEGGDASAIANAIANAIAVKKTPGGGTNGTTSIVVVSSKGIPVTINVYRPTDVVISAVVTMSALPGYTNAIGLAMQQAVTDYINGVAIGGGTAQCVEWDSCITAAKSVPGSSTFKIKNLVLTGPRGAGAPDVSLLFNEQAVCILSQVTITTG